MESGGGNLAAAAVGSVGSTPETGKRKERKERKAFRQGEGERESRREQE